MRWRVALFLAAAMLAGCGGDDGNDEAAGPTTAAAETPCRDVPQPEAKRVTNRSAPTQLLAADRKYRAVFDTSCGRFAVDLDPKASPRAVASFVALAEADYFDGTFFHRIVPGFVIQGGDPTGKGTGGPGYTTVDKPARTTTYKKGTVAMAKTAADAPGTAGSQFFVVTADDAGLPPDYAVIGHVVSGLDVVERIGLLGDPNTEHPTQPVVVDDVEIEIS